LIKNTKKWKSWLEGKKQQGKNKNANVN
jgi:hypothetical protein